MGESAGVDTVDIVSRSNALSVRRNLDLEIASG